MDLTVNKGGITWAEFSLRRATKGLDVFVRVAPQIEDFVKSLGAGKVDPVEAYGREWYPISTTELKIHRTDKKDIEGDHWIINKPGEPLLVANPRELCVGKVNLSFLKIVGISDPEGVRFGIYGPFSKDFINNYSKEIMTETRNLVQQYIVPVHINLRISSTDV